MANILIVDDDPDMVEASRMVLERDGYSVESASSVDEGLGRMAAAEPDLLILAVMMQQEDDGLGIIGSKIRETFLFFVLPGS